MSTKKVSIGDKPTRQDQTASVDQWVETRSDASEAEPMKRLTVDIPADLHRQIKAACAMRGTKITDEVREILSDNYSDTSPN